jgi:hypothetical protein
MPSNPSPLLARLSSKLSYLSRLPTRLLQKGKKSPTDDLPITRSNLAFQRERNRKLSQDESDVLCGPADTTTGTNSSNDEVWSWQDSDEKQVSITATGGTPSSDLSAEDGEEEWEEDWEPMKMKLKRGAQRKVVVEMVRKGYCDYDIEAVLAALKEPEPEEEREEGLEGAMESFWQEAWESPREVFAGRVSRQLRQVALADSDGEEEEEEEEEVVVYTRNRGNTRTRDGEVVCGDVWWKGL